MKWLKATSDTQERYYNSISELPLANWIQCNKGNIEFVRRGKSGDSYNDAVIWGKIFDSYIERFGLSPLLKRLYEVQKKKANYECEYIISRDDFKLTLISLEETKLQEMISNAGEGMDIQTTLVHLSKWLGYHLDENIITTEYYFNTLKQYGKENKQVRHK
jgi:hypothetical protein